MLTNSNYSTEQVNRGSSERQNKLNQNVMTVKDVTVYIAVMVWTFLIMYFVFSFNRIPSESMEPTIMTNSLTISWRLPFLLDDPLPERGDIITFREQAPAHRVLIKRVIGLPGDIILIEDGKVYLNGEELEEPYLMEPDSTKSSKQLFEVPDGCVFVMGDNRMHSNDSRYFENPYIPVDSIIAKYLWGFKSVFKYSR